MNREKIGDAFSLHTFLQQNLPAASTREGLTGWLFGRKEGSRSPEPSANSHVLYVEVERFSAFCDMYGQETGEFVLYSCRDRLRQTLQKRFGPNASAEVHSARIGRMVALFPAGDSTGEQVLHRVRMLRLTLNDWLHKTTMRLTRQALSLRMGHAALQLQQAKDMEQAFHFAHSEALNMARQEASGGPSQLLDEFVSILEAKRLEVRYQPLVGLGDGDLLGWEARVRGPAGSYFRTATALFDFAERENLIPGLEEAAHTAAIAGLGPTSPGQKIFINVHRRTLLEPAFSTEIILKLLEEKDIRPSNVVFEVSESHAIRDFPLFQKTLRHYRAQGFKIAVDDVGAGYTGLWSLAELAPDYVKMDASLTGNVDTHPLKRGIIKTLSTFCDQFECRLIAKGVENGSQLSSLMDLGVDYGEGYHICRPGFPKPTPDTGWMNRKHSREVESARGCNLPVRDLAAPARQTGPETKVAEAKKLFGEDGAISAVAVVDESRPIGLIMSHHLDRALSSQYGMSLYYNRSVRAIMDSTPLIAEGSTAVEEVARKAMNRDKSRIYDHIVITEQGKVSGIVSVQKMLDTLAAVQVEMAKGANPLTGLPGNVAIEREVERRCDEQQWFSIIYADLDNFKVYNDTYGFKNGDNVIRLLSDICKWAVKRHGNEKDFVGHVGGDDLILITRPETAKRISVGITRCFQRLVRHQYSAKDRQRGYIMGKDRETGEDRKFPLVSVSLAIIDCEGKVTDPADISRRSAEMKKVAKKMPGNSWTRDRRGIPGHLAN